MRKLIFQNLISVDGYFTGENRDISWHNVDSEFNDRAISFLNQVDILLFGRVTYELMAKYWPTADARKDDPIVAAAMNNTPKIVVSKTLKTVSWENTNLIKENVPAEIKKLKLQPGKDIAVFGSSDLTLTLIENELIDEFQIIVNPIILGGGKTLFSGIKHRLSLKLIDLKKYNDGNVLLIYQPIRKEM